MRKAILFLSAFLVVSGSLWAQAIPGALQGSWLANGSVVFVINSDGSGIWGDGALSQPAQFTVSGNRLHISVIGMSGSVTWSVSGNRLTVSQPNGFTGELLVQVLGMGGVSYLERMNVSAVPSSEPMLITITGIPVRLHGFSGGIMLLRSNNIVAMDFQYKFGNGTELTSEATFQMGDESVSSGMDISDFAYRDSGNHNVGFVVVYPGNNSPNEIYVLDMNLPGGEFTIPFSAFTRTR